MTDLKLSFNKTQLIFIEHLHSNRKMHFSQVLGNIYSNGHNPSLGKFKGIQVSQSISLDHNEVK